MAALAGATVAVNNEYLTSVPDLKNLPKACIPIVLIEGHCAGDAGFFVGFAFAGIEPYQFFGGDLKGLLQANFSFAKLIFVPGWSLWVEKMGEARPEQAED